MKSPEWSDVFASRLRESIYESDILGFLSTELEAEKNCAKVWKQIVSHLTSVDVNTTRMMAHWNQLFNLKCEDKDSFLSFYRTTKGLIHKLKRKNVAVTNETFLKDFFAKVIEAPELQQEVKKFIKGGTKTPARRSLNSFVRITAHKKLVRG